MIPKSGRINNSVVNVNIIIELDLVEVGVWDKQIKHSLTQTLRTVMSSSSGTCPSTSIEMKANKPDILTLLLRKCK